MERMSLNYSVLAGKLHRGTYLKEYRSAIVTGGGMARRGVAQFNQLQGDAARNFWS